MPIMCEHGEDPTRSGPPLSLIAETRPKLSRNEIESLCTRAARGAGMSWGLAEEAGFAAVWLAARGFAGTGLLAAHLHSVCGANWQDIRPEIQAGRWHARSGRLICPIALGVTLSDYLIAESELAPGRDLSVGPVGYPGLVVPFLAETCAGSGLCLSISLNQVTVEVGGESVVAGDVVSMLAAVSGSLVIRIRIPAESLDLPTDSAVNPGTPKSRTLQPCQSVSRLHVDPEALRTLDRLALQTTVPSSVGLRNDAGAGGGDND